MNKKEQFTTDKPEYDRDAVDLTLKTYKERFSIYEESTPTEVSGEAKEWMDAFASYLPKNSKILELGSATGRDARYFSSKGHKIVCTDIIPEALEQLSKEGFDTEEFDFRNDPKQEWVNHFDGFFANGVLLHAPQDIFEKTLANMAEILKEDGVAAFSLKTGGGEKLTEDKMNAPRYFNYHNETEVRDILSKLPFEIIDVSYPENAKWLCFIVKKTHVSI